MIERKKREKQFDNLFAEEGLDVESYQPSPKKRKKKHSRKDIETCAQRYLENPTDENFQNLWLRSYWGLRDHAYKLVPNNFDVDDIIINVFEIILNKKDQFNPEKGKFSTWMYKICTNECFAYWNRKNRDNYVDSDISDCFPSLDLSSDDFDCTDKFEIKSPFEMEMLQRDDIRRKFFDASINEIEKIEDFRIKLCMRERFKFFDDDGERVKPLTLEQISAKYDYPMTSIKNWVNKGKIYLRESLMKNHKELFEMWKDTLD